MLFGICLFGIQRNKLTDFRIIFIHPFLISLLRVNGQDRNEWNILNVIGYATFKNCRNTRKKVKNAQLSGLKHILGTEGNEAVVNTTRGQVTIIVVAFSLNLIFIQSGMVIVT